MIVETYVEKLVTSASLRIQYQILTSIIPNKQNWQIQIIIRHPTNQPVHLTIQKQQNPMVWQEAIITQEEKLTVILAGLEKEKLTILLEATSLRQINDLLINLTNVHVFII